MKTQNTVSWLIVGMFAFAIVMVVRNQTKKAEDKAMACGCGK